MDLRRLEYFVAVARHGHVTRAAEELHLTQSALSQLLQRLVASLGVTLLHRLARGVVMPPAGLAAGPLADERRRVAGPPGDALATAGAVGVGDLRGRAFIVGEPGTALRDEVVAACQAAGFSPVPLFEVGDPLTVRRLVAE